MPELVAVFGFGSFFRHPQPSDCDLLVVISDKSEHLGMLHARLMTKFKGLGRKLGVAFDITVLTESEHRGRPLLEHADLVPLLNWGSR